MSNNAGVLIASWQPASAFITNTKIAHISGWGISRGWEGEPIDFLPTNTFVDLAYCPQ